ncbi:hypothetical protein [Nitrosomonas aestuarii]|uniref:hypothetical protein n=1 Tax=Nitrosomonas aestuarii TaxID=52441 RepID=UPI001C637FC6|nr:hypothetical protein [Nitrosomonas aestuarii]
MEAKDTPATKAPTSLLKPSISPKAARATARQYRTTPKAPANVKANEAILAIYNV